MAGSGPAQQANIPDLVYVCGCQHVIVFAENDGMCPAIVLQAKATPQHWHLHKFQWRWLNALVPYLGPPLFTLHRIWWPFLAGDHM
jgi:hypothetical protein